MRENLRRLKIVIFVFTVLIVICLTALIILESNGPTIGSVKVADNIITSGRGK